jgi:branched-chain amino acid aminotransferase
MRRFTDRAASAKTGDNMKNSRKTWTYYKGDWHEGDIRILGAASQSTWLGSLVFDGARGFEGIYPDLDRHSDRVNESARTLGLKPTLSGEIIAGLAKDGLKKFAPDAAVYIRPMYWAEDGDVGFIVPLADSTDFALCLEEVPMAAPTGLPAADPGCHAGERQGRVPLCQQRPHDQGGQGQRFQQRPGLRCQRQRGGVGDLQRLHDPGRRGVYPDPQRHLRTFLNGITRQRVIGLLRQAGVTVHETVLTLQDFREADEIFNSGNISKVMPVVAFDDRKLEIGPIARKARALYWEWAHS